MNPDKHVVGAAEVINKGVKIVETLRRLPKDMGKAFYFLIEILTVIRNPVFIGEIKRSELSSIRHKAL